MKVLLLDNFDSFTFNLFHYLEGFDCDVTVARNNEITLAEIACFDKIVLSPGPGLPEEAGILLEVIAEFHDKKPILGVCLGMQALALYFENRLYNQPEVKHGVAVSCVQCAPNRLFTGMPERFDVGLYHSWAVALAPTNPLKAIAYSSEKVLMAVEHPTLPLFGVQFHPESVMTPMGKQIIHNFLKFS